jgi:hypothetical protein
MSAKVKVKDFAIPMDEFHPRPSTAAAFADRKANDAAIDHLTTDLKRVNAKIEASDGEDRLLLAERARIEGFLAQTRADRAKTEELIAEARVK